VAVGLRTYGVYIPTYRLQREEIAKFWGTAYEPGEKAIANFDEDAITMAVEAARDCLDNSDDKSVDVLYFASTSSPYKETTCASFIASALDLPSETCTADFSNSLRAGTQALYAALNIVRNDKTKKVLVIASDCRQPAPNSELELNLGDGAVAFLIGESPGIGSFLDEYFYSEPFLEIWKVDEEDYLKTWDQTFTRAEGYKRVLKRGITNALNRFNLSTQQFAQIATYYPSKRELFSTLGDLGFEKKTQMYSGLIDSVGNTGCAMPLMSLIDALGKVIPGDRVLLCGYGEGCDIFSIVINESVKTNSGKVAAEKHVLIPYKNYLKFRNLLKTESPRSESSDLLLPELWRNIPQMLSFHASKCNNCGTIHFPIQRICSVCHSRDNFIEVRLSEKRGKVFTYTVDHLVPSPNPPTIRAVIDCDDARVTCLMTDCETEDLKIGMPVQMTFRKLEVTEGVRKYLWKCKPSRDGSK